MRSISRVLSLSLVLSSGLLGTAPAHADPGLRLRQAIASGNAEATQRLLDAGADANAVDSRGEPISNGLGAGQHYTDDELLEVAKLLESHGCRFEHPGTSIGPDLIANLATRRVPRTIAFLVEKKIPGDYTRALRAVSRRDDIETIKALLDGGADPLAGVARSSALLDATFEANAAAVSEMLKHVADKQSPKVLATYEIAVTRGLSEVAHAFVAGGVKPPPPVEPKKPVCAGRSLTTEESALLSRLEIPNAKGLAGLAGPMTCKFIQECGDLVLIDCNSAADGPAYYLDKKASKLVSTCGGACMHGCHDCPPKAWHCSCTF